MKVLICGGRRYDDADAIKHAIGMVGASEVITGGASGADDIAYREARLLRLPVTVYEADWKTHGKAAGPIRNQKMLDDGKPDLVIAFPGGRGTADMVRRAKAAGVSVMEIQDEITGNPI